MNKDLDERIVPQGEYRDALNIQVSTSDDSDVGTVQNLWGNFRSPKVGFYQIYHRTGTITASTSRYVYAINSDLASTAETIGTVADTTKDKIYNFVRNASDFSTTWPHVGVRSDAIIECETLDRGNGLSGFRQPVLVDAYRVQRAAVNLGASTNITLTETSTVSGVSVNAGLVGIELGMTVDLINEAGTSFLVDANGNAISSPVVVTGLGISSKIVTVSQQVLIADNTPSPDNTALVWVFERPRFLNFQEGILLPTSIGGSDTTYTPFKNIVNGIDIIDGFLFWTDNNSEPKKIKIDRFRKGGVSPLSTIDGPGGLPASLVSHTIYQTTRLLRPLNNAETTYAGTTTNGGYSIPTSTTQSATVMPSDIVQEENITVIRKNPLRAPTVQVEVAKINKYNVDVPASSVNLTGKQPGDVFTLSLPLTGVLANATALDLFQLGDLVTLVGLSGQTDAACQVLIESVHTIASSVASFEVSVLQNDLDASDLSAGVIPNTGTSFTGACTFKATLGDGIGAGAKQKTIYAGAFPRFATRWKYVDGEVSAFSPFTKPIFVPGDYSFATNTDGANDAEAYNTAMENRVTKIILKDLMPASTPLDVVGVEVLQSLSNSPSVFTVKEFARKDFYNVNTSNFHPASALPLHRGTSFESDRRFNNVGTFEIDSELTGTVIENEQLLRPFDNVPRKALGQCITANRLIFANYVQNYDIANINGDPIEIDLDFGLKYWPGENNPFYNIYSGVSASDSGTALNLTAANYDIEPGQFISGIDANGDAVTGGTTVASVTDDDTLVASANIENMNIADGATFQFYNKRYAVSTKESLKSNRTYEIGVVFRDEYGRETPVLTSKKSSLTVSNYYSPSVVKPYIRMNNEVPHWAKSYKFYIKETSNEYYNVPLYKAYNASEHETNGEAWLLFNSSESNKISEGDTLTPKNAHGTNNYQGSVRNEKQPEYRVLSKETIAPTLATSVNGAIIDYPDRLGKFYIKVTNDATLRATIGSDFSGNDDSIDTDANPTIFETKPDPDVGLNIWYEASQAYPVKLDEKSIYDVIQFGSVTGDSSELGDAIEIFTSGADGISTRNASADRFGLDEHPFRVTAIGSLDEASGSIPITINSSDAIVTKVDIPVGEQKGSIFFIKQDGSAVALQICFDGPNVSAYSGTGGNNMKIDVFPNTSKSSDGANDSGFAGFLNWYNSFSHGNGVESNRIRDDFNEITIDNGVRASSTFENYREDHRKHGIIFSGLYNSNSSTNKLNQFIQALAITKDLNPEYGSIQKLFSRNTDVLAFCEDKVLKILANKDALFNASGNTNLTSVNAVLGQSIPFSGEYGISTDPESFAADEYRCYFTDRQRGAVIRLSRDGVTPISDIGMSDHFGDLFAKTSAIVGSYDTNKGDYNITVHSTKSSGVLDKQSIVKNVETVSYSESSKGWVSFKSFIPEAGISINDEYYTFKNGMMYLHHYDAGSSFLAFPCGTFYGTTHECSVTPVLNDVPDAVKSFQTLNYSGTQSRWKKDITATLASQTNSGSAVLTFTTDINVPTGMTLTANVAGVPAGTTVSSTANVLTDANQDSLIVTMSANATTNIAAGSIVTFYDFEFYNNFAANAGFGGESSGWYVDSITTDLQTGSISDFVEKEGRWYNFIRGEKTTWTNASGLTVATGVALTDAVGNLDPREFSFQGVGAITGDGTINLVGTSAANNAIKIFDTADVDIIGQANLYTTSSITVFNVAGAQTTSHNLVITPDDGVFIQASDFIAGNGTASSGTTFTHGTNDVSFTIGGNTFISTVVFSNTATAAQLLVGFTGNTVIATVTLNGFTVSGNMELPVDIDTSAEGTGTQPGSGGFGSWEGRLKLKTNKFIGQDHTLVIDDNSGTSTTVTAIGGLFDDSWDDVSYQTGTVTSAVSNNVTIGIDEDIAANLTAGAAGHTVRNTNQFGEYGTMNSVSDEGSTTNIVFASGKTAAEDDVLEFFNGAVENSGFIGLLQIVSPFEFEVAFPIAKFLITCASNHHIHPIGASVFSTTSPSNFTSNFIPTAFNAAGLVTAGEVHLQVMVPDPNEQISNSTLLIAYQIQSD